MLLELGNKCRTQVLKSLSITEFAWQSRGISRQSGAHNPELAPLTSCHTLALDCELLYMKSCPQLAQLCFCVHF